MPATGGAGGEPSLAGAGSGAVAGEGGSGGGESGEGNAGAGGDAPVDECADDPTVELDAPLATTSLTFVAPVDVSLGQGVLGDPLEHFELKSSGCVTGTETNASIALHAGGIEMFGGGSDGFGRFRPKPPSIASFLAPGSLSSFEATLGQHSDRALYGYADTWVSAFSYLMLYEKRSEVSDCGDGFVRALTPRRGMAVVFKVVLPSVEERDQFERCQGSGDVLDAADLGPASRYLVKHGASLAIHVLRAAGSAESTQQLLDESQCSAADLSACRQTLDALNEQQAQLGKAPDDKLALAQLMPEWGIFNFKVSPYTILP